MIMSPAITEKNENKRRS